MGRESEAQPQLGASEMPIRVNEASDEHFLVVHVWGKLSETDYERFFVQFAELPKKPRILFDMIGFEGWDAGALWDDIKFDIKHANDFERIATVGDSIWEHAMATLIKPFTKSKTRYFDATHYAAAREWLSE
jgi:hypothetical protein